MQDQTLYVVTVVSVCWCVRSWIAHHYGDKGRARETAHREKINAQDLVDLVHGAHVITPRGAEPSARTIARMRRFRRRRGGGP